MDGYVCTEGLRHLPAELRLRPHPESETRRRAVHAARSDSSAVCKGQIYTGVRGRPLVDPRGCQSIPGGTDRLL